MVLLQTAENKSRTSIDKEDIVAVEGLLQLHDCFSAKEQTTHRFEDTTATTKNKKKSRSSAVKDHKIAKTKPNMNGQSRRTTRPRKEDRMKPETSDAKRLLQLYIKNFTRSDKGVIFTPHLKEYEEVQRPNSHHMGLIDKFKEQGEEDHQRGDDEEESKSDVSYITDDSSDMKMTPAEISAAQQIMQLGNSQQQAATTTTTAERKEESSYMTTSAGVVSSTRKGFEESNVFLRRKRKFRSLADLYETTTQPL